MEDTENLIQKFRQKFKHSQFVNYSAIELWLEEQIPLIKAEAVREERERIIDLTDGIVFNSFEKNSTQLKRFIWFLDGLQPKTQDSEAGGDVDCFCHCHQNYHAFSANEIDVCDTPQRRCRHCEAGGD